MEHARLNEGRVGCRFGMMLGGAALVFALILTGTVAPQGAYAVESAAQADTVLTTQASTGLATATKSSINSTVKKNAKAIVKSAKATSGTALAKLKKIYTYIAQPTEYGGTFAFGSYHGDFYFVAKGKASEKYYPATPPVNMGDYYKKYAIDAYKIKKASCYHYAALFAVAAKSALGSSATVKIAVGGTNETGAWNDHHAWVEVTIGKTVYLYDPMNGYNWAKDEAKKKSAFGVFCGNKKSASKVKKYYKNGKAAAYKGVKYCTVKL